MTKDQMTRMAVSIQKWVERSLRPFMDRVKALEEWKNAFVLPKDGENGKDVDPAVVEALVAKAVAQIAPPKPGEPGRDGKDADIATVELLVRAAVAQIPAPQNGKDADPALIAAEVQKAIAAIPKPENGKDGTSVDPVAIEAMVQRAVAAIPKPQDGKDGEDGKDAVLDLDLIRAEVSKAVAALPKPKDGEKGQDGKDVSIETVKALVDGIVADRIAQIPKPKDGDRGTDGDHGASAYEIAVQRGFSGSQAEWLQSLQGRPGEDGKSIKGEPGKDVSIETVRTLVEGEVSKAIQAIPLPKPGRDGEDGKSVEPEAVRAMVRELVAEIPRPENGKSVDPAEVEAMIRKAVDAIPRPENGKDGKPVDPGVLEALVIKHVSAIPKPADGEDGKSVDMAEVEILVRRLFDAIPKPKDGENGKDANVEVVAALVAKDLQARMTDVINTQVASLMGAAVEKRVSEMLEAIAAKAAALVPPGRDGISIQGDHGRDGTDGFSPDDFSLSIKDGRTVVIAMRCGDRVIEKSLHLDGFPIYKGIYQSGASYSKDDTTTYGGSIWRALKDTKEPPKGPSDDWHLVVKGGK